MRHLPPGGPACGTPSGGENLLKHAGRVYVIDVHAPERFANGALRGRVYRFGPGGLLDIGRYKIAADGMTGLPSCMAPRHAYLTELEIFVGKGWG
ncbi:MAG TPA: hypothetical protein VMU92_07095 [Acidobacteriaceae bacterium]|nr:hypothetical protein [Acidobacteriaceae bacterium]